MKQLFLATLIFIAVTTKIFAVRPFITDDAAVVGERLLQLETWLIFDKFSGQHWMMWAYGPHKQLEMAVGAVFGYEQSQPKYTKFSYAMPLLEMKYLFGEYKHNKPPGIASVTGTFLPTGKGEFVAPGYGAYSFMAITQCFGKDENILIHGNIGLNYLYINKENQFVLFWGLGTQIKIHKDLHFVGEFISGDPYVSETGVAYQTGFRYFINDHIQIDAEVGQGLTGQDKMPFWCGLGLRLVITTFEKKS